MDVLIKEIDINHLKNEVMEIDFQALVSGEMIHSVAEIILLGHDKVAEGIVEQHLHEISYRALPSALVEKVEVDVAEMKVGDSIKVKDLPIASDKDVHLMTDPEAVVVSVGLAHNAVSYTHLDVYKRQGNARRPCQGFFPPSGPGRTVPDRKASRPYPHTEWAYR